MLPLLPVLPVECILLECTALLGNNDALYLAISCCQSIAETVQAETT